MTSVTSCHGRTIRVSPRVKSTSQQPLGHWKIRYCVNAATTHDQSDSKLRQSSVCDGKRGAEIPWAMNHRLDALHYLSFRNRSVKKLHIKPGSMLNGHRMFSYNTTRGRDSTTRSKAHSRSRRGNIRSNIEYVRWQFAQHAPVWLYRTAINRQCHLTAMLH